MVRKLPTLLLISAFCISTTATFAEVSKSAVCPNVFLQPQFCPLSEAKAQSSTNKSKSQKPFFKMVFKTIVKSFIKSSVNSFIKTLLKELLAGISNDFIRSIIQTLIKLLANVTSNLLTYAFTQYLIKLIIKKITKTAKKIVRVTLFKGLLKKGVKFVASKFSKPFIVRVNEKTKVMITSNIVVRKSQAIVKKLDKLKHFKGLNKLKKSKLVKKYKKFIEKAWNNGRPSLEIRQLFNSYETVKPTVINPNNFNLNQQIAGTKIEYSFDNQDQTYNHIDFDIQENQDILLDTYDCNSLGSCSNLSSITSLTDIVEEISDLKTEYLGIPENRFVKFMIVATGLYKFVAAGAMVTALRFGSSSAV